MKHSKITKSFNAPEFTKKINKISRKYKIPVSEGHLKDLAVSFNPKNQENIKSDLQYIIGLSQCYVLVIVDNTEEIIPIKFSEKEIHNLFNSIVKETSQNIEINVKGESFKIDMTSLPKDDIFRPFLEKNSGILSPDVMSNILFFLYQNMDNPDLYKRFRKQIYEVKQKIQNGNTIIDNKSEYFNKIFPFLEFITSEKPESYLEGFDDIIKSFRNINNKPIENMKIGKKIELIYMMLDIHPQFRDKINKKNRPSNIGRDCKNLFFASNAEYYVTEDSSTRKKAEFVCNALSLKVKICSMSEFLSRFC